MNLTRWTSTLALILIYLVLWSFSAHAQGPNPSTPAYNVCVTDSAGVTHCGSQQVDSGHPLPVNATATLAGGFTDLSTGTPISVTTSGVTGTLPAGSVVIATNTGTTNTAFCKLGASA